MNLRKMVLKHLERGVSARWDQLYVFFNNSKDSLAEDFRRQYELEELIETLWQLVAEKLVYIDNSDPQPGHWGWMLTKRGKKAASSSGYEPDDPDGYIKDLKEAIPKLDKIILLYFEEALKSYNADCFLASTVMLGVASERAFQLLGESFVKWLPGAEKTGFLKILDSRKNYIEKFEEFRKLFDQHMDDIRINFSKDIKSIKIIFEAMLHLYRINRNKFGHPTGNIINQSEAHRYLTIFAFYLQDIYALRKFFIKNAVI
jgi:hypothetical protein